MKTAREKELFKSALLESTVYDNMDEVDFVKLAKFWNDSVYPEEDHVQVTMKQVNHLRKYMKDYERSQYMLSTLYPHKNDIGSVKNTLRVPYSGDRGTVDSTLSVPVSHVLPDGVLPTDNSVCDTCYQSHIRGSDGGSEPIAAPAVIVVAAVRPPPAKTEKYWYTTCKQCGHNKNTQTTSSCI